MSIQGEFDYCYKNSCDRKQRFEQSLWLKSPQQSQIEELYKREEESIGTSFTDSEHPKKKKVESEYIINEQENANSCCTSFSSSQRNRKLDQSNETKLELNYTFSKGNNNNNNETMSFKRARETSIENKNLKNQTSFLKESNLSENINPKSAYMKRQDSFNKKQIHKPSNVQKEILNKFMLMYNKQKFQITKLDVIVRLKTKLKYFFRNYTYTGRAYLINENSDIKKLINDKSDAQYTTSENKRVKEDLQRDRDVSINHGIIKQNYFDVVVNFLGDNIFKAKSIMQKLNVIRPHQDWVIAVNILFIVLNYIFFFFLSLIASFDDMIPISHDSVQLYHSFTMLQWVFEIIVKINTSTFHKGQFIHDRKTILILYLKKSFFYDIIPLILMQFSLQQTTASKIIRLILFIKIINILSDQNDVEKILLMRIQYHYYIDMFNLVINIHVVGHIIALGYYLLSILEEYLGYEETWKNQLAGSDGQWWRLYLESMYWAFTLMTTGSNIGTTVIETFYVTAIMMAVFVLFGYIINMIGLIIVEMQKISDDKKRDINVINKYMNRKNTSKGLKHKVNLDLEYFYQRSIKKKSEDEQNVLNKISQELSEGIQLEYNKKMVSKIKFLSQNFSQYVIDQLCIRLEETFYSPNQTIYKEDSSQLDPPIIYVISGHADVLKEITVNKTPNMLDKIKLRKRGQFQSKFNGNDQIVAVGSKQEPDHQNTNSYLQVVAEIKEGQAFGEKSFFTGNSNPCEIRSADFTTVLKLERSAFLKIIKESERDFQIFNEIKDKALFMNDFSAIGLKCKICKSYSHQERQCSKCNFNRNNPIFFARLNRNCPQERSEEYIRNRKQKFNAVCDMILIIRDVEKIIDQIEVNTFDGGLFQSFEVNEFTDQDQDGSQEFKISVESIKEDILQNQQQQQTQQLQNSQKQIPQKQSTQNTNPSKQDEKQIYNQQGSLTELAERNMSYLSANLHSKQVEDESNYSNYNPPPPHQNQKRLSIIGSSHLQPIVYKQPSDQVQISNTQLFKDIHRDQKSLSSIKERDLISQISQVDRRSKKQQTFNISGGIMEEFLKIYNQFQQIQQGGGNQTTKKQTSQTRINTTTVEQKRGNLYEQDIFEDERLKQDQYWQFDQQQDYNFYFPDYNHQSVLFRQQNARKKIQKEKQQNLFDRQGTVKKIKTLKTFV